MVWIGPAPSKTFVFQEFQVEQSEARANSKACWAGIKGHGTKETKKFVCNLNLQKGHQIPIKTPCKNVILE
jgi:hypothetical protein